jgi:hypothetical protein
LLVFNFFGLFFILAPNVIIPEEVIDFDKHTILGIIIGLGITLLGLGMMVVAIKEIEQRGFVRGDAHSMSIEAISWSLMFAGIIISIIEGLSLKSILIGIAFIVSGVFILLIVKYSWEPPILIFFLILIIGVSIKYLWKKR